MHSGKGIQLHSFITAELQLHVTRSETSCEMTSQHDVTDGKSDSKLTRKLQDYYKVQVFSIILPCERCFY